jgi:hypothetical protein
MTRLYTVILLMYTCLMPLVLLSTATCLFSLNELPYRVLAVCHLAMAILSYVILLLALLRRVLERAVYFLVFTQSALVLVTALVGLA